jgi:DNA-binding NtrC family response regulator
MARYLVVDNNASTVWALSRLLADDGHDVASFTNGGDAVDAIHRDAFDAVVTDLNMPRVNGRAVLRAARQRQPDACTVVVTGRAEDEHDSLVADGACIVAEKPVRYDDMVTMVADCRALGGPAAAGACPLQGVASRLLPMLRGKSRSP